MSRATPVWPLFLPLLLLILAFAVAAPAHAASSLSTAQPAVPPTTGSASQADTSPPETPQAQPSPWVEILGQGLFLPITDPDSASPAAATRPPGDTPLPTCPALAFQLARSPEAFAAKLMRRFGLLFALRGTDDGG